MKCIAAIEVDLHESPIGTRSRVLDELNGRPILTRTVEQLAQSQRISHTYVICRADQRAGCERLIPGELRDRVSVRPARIEAAPFRRLVKTARKWSLDGSRGGVGGVCSMDEYTRSDELAIVAHEASADALFCASPAAPLLDPELADIMIDHCEQTVDEARLTFTQSPPGLSGTVYTTGILIEMGQQHVPPGIVLSYKPDKPMMDLAHKSCCYTATEAVRHAVGRLIVDTDRAYDTVRDYLNTRRRMDAESVGQWLMDRSQTCVPELPREVEIELTTDDQLTETRLRPRGSTVNARGAIDLAIVKRIAKELATYDDSLVVLGGFGEPLLHAEFCRIIEILREAGVYGIAVRTNLLALTDAHIDAMVEHQVDIVSPVLDAWTPGQYARVHGADRLGEAIDKLNRLTEIRGDRQSVAPLIVPEITKCADTIDELDAFFDGWVRQTGWATVAGYSHFAGQRPDRSLVQMTPPTRFACRQIVHRATIVADGRMLACDQDFNALHAVGSLTDHTLVELWQGEAMTRIRRRHREGHFDGIALCGRCDEWHRS